jgi:nucleotide-binding universal stress UspA family protein
VRCGLLFPYRASKIRRCFGSVEPVDVDVVIDNGHAANRIPERARSLPADLIVIGTHGAGGFEDLVLGSVTEKVLRAGCFSST